MRRAVLMVLLAACGDDGVRHTPDATPHDGPADSPIDGALQPVTLTATRNGTPVPGVHVYFQNADSSVVLASVTDAAGTASAVMAAGGYVTAVDPYNLPAFGVTPIDVLDTFVGVKPGDQLRLALSNVSTGITVTVNATADTAANSMSVYSPCAPAGVPLNPPPQALVAGPVSASMTLTNCGATTDFLIVSYDQSFQPLNTAYVANVAVADQGTVDLTAATLAGATTKTWTYTNVPAQTSLSLEDDLIDAHGKIFTTYNETPSDTQNPTLTMPVPAFTGAAQLVQTSYYNGTQHTFLDWGPYASTFTTDIAARDLADFTAAPAFDAATHAASITEAMGGAADFTLTFLSASRTADNHQWSWNVASPHATTITLPTLPTDVYDFNIVASDTVNVDTWVAGKVPGGYDAVRASLLATSGPADLAALGTTGSATVVEYQPPAARSVRFGSRDTMADHAQALPRRVLPHRVR